MNCRRAVGAGLLGIGAALLGAQGTGEAPRVVWLHLSSLKGEIPAPDLGRQVASLILDVDRDGLNDFVIASYEKMAWFRRGAGGWTRFCVENGAAGVRMEAGGDFRDLDGDGRPDLLQKDFQKDRRVDVWLNRGRGGYGGR